MKITRTASITFNLNDIEDILKEKIPERYKDISFIYKYKIPPSEFQEMGSEREIFEITLSYVPVAEETKDPYKQYEGMSGYR